VNLAALKTVGVFALLGAIVGDVLATLIAPSFLTWYNTPGAGAIQTICEPATMSRTIFNQLIRSQLVGALVGAVALAVVGALVVRRRMARGAPAAS
jgi:hypothetical protein